MHVLKSQEGPFTIIIGAICYCFQCVCMYLYGKPAQLKAQTLQFEVDETRMIIETVKKENDELNAELSQMRADKEHIMSERLELLQMDTNLKEQVSFVQEEMEQNQQLLTLTEDRSYNQNQELHELKAKLRKSVHSQEKAMKESEHLKEIHLQNMDQNGNIKRQLKEKEALIRSLQLQYESSIVQTEKYEALVEKYEEEINLLESENAERMQEMELLRRGTGDRIEDDTVFGLNRMR
eukprot:721633_1